MSALTDRCVLCDQPIVMGSVGGMTDEARRLFESRFGRGSTDDMPAVCDSCLNLPPAQRKAAANAALRRTVGEMYDDLCKVAKPPLDRDTFIENALKRSKK